MKFPKALALAGLALALGTAPAWAADWGGIKDMGGGVAVPVPAPAPVPTFDADSDWYVGLAHRRQHLAKRDDHGYRYDYLGTMSGVWTTAAISEPRQFSD